LLLFGGLIGDGSAKIPPLAALCSTVGMTTLFGRTGGRILRLRFAPLRMTVTKNGALVERAGVGTGPYMGGGGRILRFRSFVAPLRMTGSKNGAQAVRAGVGTGPYMGGGGRIRPLRFAPLRMTVTKNGALVERAGVGTGPYIHENKVF